MNTPVFSFARSVRSRSLLRAVRSRYFAHRRPLLFGDDEIDKRMFRREHHERRAVKRVGTRRENADFSGRIVDLEIDLCAFASADPVALEQFDSFRPIESVQFVEQSLRIRGDAQHPLPHRPPDDREAADLAFAIDNFFIGQNGAELRTPVHRNVSDISEPNAIRIIAAIGRNRLGLVRLRIEPGIVNLEKNPLRPFVIARIGRVDLALPIVGETDALELRFEFRDVLARGDRRDAGRS